MRNNKLIFSVILLILLIGAFFLYKKYSGRESSNLIVLPPDPHQSVSTFNFRYKLAVFDTSTGSIRAKSFISINGGTGATTGIGPGRLFTYNQINDVPVSIICPTSGPAFINIRFYTLTGGFNLANPLDVVKDTTIIDTIPNCQTPTLPTDPRGNFKILAPGATIWYRNLLDQPDITIDGTFGHFRQVVTWPPTR